MKKIMLLLCTLLVSACGEEGPACLETAGETRQELLELPAFDRITVREGVALVLEQGARQKVVLEVGENLRDKVSATVTEGRLELRNGTSCNLYRAYEPALFRVTVPELRELRSSTGWEIRSEGSLDFEDLLLLSESFLDPESETTDGNFDLQFSGGRLRAVLNGIAYLQLRGKVDRLQLQIAAGDSRIDARALRAGTVTIDHRGSNAMLIYPEESLHGVIRGTGDVRSFNRPPEVSVETRYKGKLIFE